jgi:hypothetical protein
VPSRGAVRASWSGFPCCGCDSSSALLRGPVLPCFALRDRDRIMAVGAVLHATTAKTAGRDGCSCEHHPPADPPFRFRALPPPVRFHFSSGYVLKLIETDPVTADLTASRSL